MITDAIAELIEAGVVTGARKSVDRGLVVTGFLMGTSTLIARAAAIRRFTCVTPPTPTTRRSWPRSTSSSPSTPPPRST